MNGFEVCFPANWYNKAGGEIKKNASPPGDEVTDGFWSNGESGARTEGCATTAECGVNPNPDANPDDAASYFVVQAAATFISGVYIMV